MTLPSLPPRRRRQQPRLRALCPAAVLAAVLATGAAAPASANECMIGEVRLFAGNFEPKYWRLAYGQILSIAQNSALFSILGTTYGGNGATTFALPDLRGRTAVGAGQAPGLSPWSMGEQRGSETRTLSANQLPPHTHSLNVASNVAATTGTPASDKLLAVAQNAGLYAPGTPSVALHGASVGITGQGQPFSIQPPSLGMNYMICVAGIFPARE